ncbi:MAG: helix-turn-helix transcriptional regulator [Actinobacteria bacterium]|nr:helix-turn-helix transcriptional regulator [Actinomycetota bacterium]
MPEPSAAASSPATGSPATSAAAAEPSAPDPSAPEPSAPELSAPELAAPGLATAGGAPVAENGAADELAGGIGRRLAAHRSRRGIRVAELARVVGVTPSLISQIERGTSRPSVSTLFALAEALNVPVDAFFRESPARRPGQPPDRPGPLPDRPGQEPGHETGGRYLVRRENRATIDIEGGVRWERLTRNTLDHLDFFELVYEPGAESHPRQYTHPGTEMVLMIRGCLEITVGFERYRLEPGDSIDFPSSMPHRYLNPGTETARAVTVIFYDCPGPPGSAPRPAGRAGHS